MKNLFRILFIVTIVSSCHLKADKKYNRDLSKIDRIDSILDSIGFISLPFVANFDTTIKNTYRLNASNDLDTILIKDFSRLGDVYLIGFLPDTTDFYAILFLGIAAVSNPGLITFDKTGTKISSEFITEENCLIYVGDILYCCEYTQINSDLTLKYVYKSIVIQEKADMTSDTIFTHIIRNGKIRNNGILDLGRFDTIEFDNKTTALK